MQAVQVAAAQGERTVVLCTGGRTETGAMALLPDLPEVCFVEVGDFTGAALRTAAGARRGARWSSSAWSASSPSSPPGC